jgi:hypothetical protein
MALPVGLPDRLESKGGWGSEDRPWGYADRYLMVRSPYARYVSMYEYLKAPHNYSKFGAREIQGREWRGWGQDRQGLKHKPLTFEAFLHFIAEQRVVYADRRWSKRRGDLTDAFAYRSPWVWLDSLEDSARLLASQPGGGVVTLIWLERFWEGMATLKERYKMVGLSVKPSIQANKTLTYSGDATSYWSKVGKSAVQAIGVNREIAALDQYPFLWG